MQREIQVMRVIRIPPVGKLVVEVNNQRYTRLDEIEAPNIRQMVLAAIGEMVVFAGGYDTLADAGFVPPIANTPAQSKPQSPPTPEPVPEPATSPPQKEEEPLTPEQAKFLASLQAETEVLKAKPVKPSPSVLNRGVIPQPRKRATTTPSPTIVSQIDAILQKYVEADSELAHRSIHLKQNPDGGLLIEVDGKYYQRPRELEEAKIKTLIKRALKEWENS